MAKKNGNQPTLAELQAQRQDLAGRLGAIDGQLARLDPVASWELVSRALAEQSALTMAVAALDERIAAAELAERAANREAQEQARSERAVAARSAMDDAARRYVDAVLALPAADLAQAQHELGAVGGFPSGAAGVALELANRIDATLPRLRLIAPGWLGLPVPDKHAQLVAEARAALERAERRLAELRKLQAGRRYIDAGAEPIHGVTKERLDDAQLVVDNCRQRLAALAA